MAVVAARRMTPLTLRDFLEQSSSEGFRSYPRFPDADDGGGDLAPPVRLLIEASLRRSPSRSPSFYSFHKSPGTLAKIWRLSRSLSRRFREGFWRRREDGDEEDGIDIDERDSLGLPSPVVSSCSSSEWERNESDTELLATTEEEKCASASVYEKTSQSSTGSIAFDGAADAGGDGNKEEVDGEPVGRNLGIMEDKQQLSPVSVMDFPFDDDDDGEVGSDAGGMCSPSFQQCLAELQTMYIAGAKYYQEYVYNRLQFSFGWYFTFVQGFVYLGLIRLQGFTVKQMVNPWRTYVRLSAVLMGSHGLTKGSLAFLNYPAQIMFKSTKVLPVMIMGAFIPGLRRKYPFHEYVSAVMLVIGLILFTLADAQSSPNFSMIGVAMVSGALVMDAFLGNLQEAIFKMNPDTTQMEMLFCSTVVGLPFLVVPMVSTGELMTAWSACSQHMYVYAVLVFEAMATFVEQVSVLSLIALFGAATTAMVTTARKAVTLLLSYLIFTKPLTEQHVTGLLLISMGIVLKLLPENKENGPRRQVRTVQHCDDRHREIREVEEEKAPLV